ncbi:hypothetical protein V6N11_059665 [Hibiscus sabdariffa]|uniref:Uncharacterized protein n=1 Tax=Hibiscus sabdariffa TaxID=183260 RepID=A0ABR2NXX4_9ROSI
MESCFKNLIPTIHVKIFSIKSYLIIESDQNQRVSTPDTNHQGINIPSFYAWPKRGECEMKHVLWTNRPLHMEHDGLQGLVSGLIRIRHFGRLTRGAGQIFLIPENTISNIILVQDFEISRLHPNTRNLGSVHISDQLSRTSSCGMT